MSLLLDALRRAEEARRAKEADNNAAQTDSNVSAASAARAKPLPASPERELALGDMASITPDKSPAVDANDLVPFTAYQSGLALEELSVPVVAPKATPVPRPEVTRSPGVAAGPSPAEITQRDIARNVFTAKQPSLQSVNDTGKRKWVLPVVVGILAVLGAGGWYVWNEINRVSPPTLARNAVPPVALPRAAPSTGQIGSKPAAAPETIAVKPGETPMPPLLPPPAIEPPLPKLPATSAPERVLTERQTVARNLKDAPVAKEAPVGLRLARTLAPPTLNPEISIAYQSLASGDYVLAQQQYAKLVQAEPLNVDARLGLATAAARGGDNASAIRHYRQVLALDPRNGLAIMGLVALNEGAQPASLEIELRTLIGRNPDAAPLHFALGNLYATGRRWTEAQQAYFEAFRIDPVNPDYLFNLAVSLDQLKQTRLALDYYRKAEAMAAARGGGQFDRNTIATRIRDLSSETGRSH